MAQRSFTKGKHNMAKLLSALQIQARLLHSCKNASPLFHRATYAACHRRHYSSSQHISSSPIPEFDGRPDLKTHEDLYQFSLTNHDEFWGTLAKSRLRWFQDFDQVYQGDFASGNYQYFSNGKINVSVNCVDRHYERTPDKVALIWEKDEPGNQEYITYKQLYEMMNQVANTLKSHGVEKGDRVLIYMPVSPLAVASMLACARIGALHSVVFAGFSADALATRIRDADAKVVITTDQAVRGGKIIELKKIVDQAVSTCPAIQTVFVTTRTGADVSMGKKDIRLEEAMSKESTECEPAVMDSNDLLFLLYTSGSTGKPKGVAHTQAGYLLYATLTHKLVFDYHEGDIFGCVADIGWITGHSYVLYGPLSNGATTILFESVPTYPDPGRYWETTARLGMNQIYLAPTALRLLLKFGDEWVKKHDRSSLRTLGSVGEPLNHEAWEWYHKVVGEERCPIVDTWWQTETGGIAITPRPSAPGAVIKAGMPMRPFFGIEPALVNKQGQEITKLGERGALCVKKPWPGLMKTVYGDHERYLDTYLKPYPGYYYSGDGARKDEEGFVRITGRMDDVMNISGHRLGTAEIEDVMDEHPLVAETAVVGFPHEIKGEGVYAYVVLKEKTDKPVVDIITELKSLVRQQIAGYAVPEIVQVAPGLPKTRSGKIMRRVLRKVAANQPDQLGDISTLADPSVVATIVENHDKIVKTLTK